jgi:hypothetical protein
MMIFMIFWLTVRKCKPRTPHSLAIIVSVVALFAGGLTACADNPKKAVFPRLRILIPAYIYLDAKGEAEWEEIFAASSRVPIVAILNAANGPGKAPEASYAKLLEKAQTCRVNMIGYVDTTYAKRSLQDVKDDVDRWIRFYPGIQGIFLDQQASGREQVDYYKKLYIYIRETRGLKLVVSNPGTLCDEIYFRQKTADVICLHEGNEKIDRDFFPKWTSQYPATNVFVTQYGVKTENEMLAWVDLVAQKNFGYIYITDRDGDNPWDSLPSYWQREVETVRTVNTQIPAKKP